ncbi:MAG: FAD-binding oxidoreductase [Desulfobacterales bacterium]|jgi:ferredoxin-NADP reductase|nr:FAD-binding oxidoreductase [Desulfobacterales bacterium]
METVTAESPGRSGPAAFRTRLLARRPLAASAFELSLAKPAGFTFTPGQRVRVHHAEAARDYSIAAAPGEEIIRLCLRRVATGGLSARLAEIPLGAELVFTGPHGYFTFQASARPAVFAATGTGVAPFCAMAAAGVSGFILLHGVAAQEELFYGDLLREKAAAYVPCLSGGRAAAAGHYRGRVTDYLRAQLPAGAYDFYLCGRQEMIRDATLLADERFPGSLVFSEVFY